MSRLHFNILSPGQQEVFRKLRIFKKEASLAGGTALALQIAHRYSLDFDLFFTRKLRQQDLTRAKRHLKIKEVSLNTQEQVNFVTSEEVRVNLVRYPFPPLFRRVVTPSLPLLAVKDIALDKAYTVGRRAAWRDYVDLFSILKEGYLTLAQILRLAPRKFGIEFNGRLFLEQLVYFRDLEITKVSFMDKEISPEIIKKFLLAEAKKLQLVP